MNSLHLARALVALAAIALDTGAPLRAADPNHFPDDTALAVAVNLKQIFASEVVKASPDAVGELKDVLGELAGMHAAQKYLKELDLDAFRDLRSATFVYTGAKSPQVSFLIFDGTFDAEKLSAAAKARDATVRVKKSGTVPLYEVTPRGEKPFHAALVNASTLIAATTEEALTDALGRAAGTKKSGLKKEMRRLLEAVGDEQSVAFVATGSALARVAEAVPVPNGQRATAFLETLDAVAGGFTLAKGVQFQLTFNADTEDAAKKLTESANGAIRILTTLVKQAAERDEKLAPVTDVVKGLRFANQGTEIALRGELTLDVVEKLLKNFPPGPAPADKK